MSESLRSYRSWCVEYDRRLTSITLERDTVGQRDPCDHTFERLDTVRELIAFSDDSFVAPEQRSVSIVFITHAS